MGIRVLATALAASLCFGCFALDLIDEGLEDMKKHSPKSSKAEKSETSPAGPQEEDQRSSRELVGDWWSQARSLAPVEDDAGIVRCELGGSIQFTSRSDCQTRGGRARSVGGS